MLQASDIHLFYMHNPPPPCYPGKQSYPRNPLILRVPLADIVVVWIYVATIEMIRTMAVMVERDATLHVNTITDSPYSKEIQSKWTTTSSSAGAMQPPPSRFCCHYMSKNFTSAADLDPIFNFFKRPLYHSQWNWNQKTILKWKSSMEM